MATALGVVSYIFTGLGLLTKEAPLVEIGTGKLQGNVATSRGGREYFEYLGIPYAKPPVGDLRFEAPVAADPWSGTVKAKTYGADCIQFDAIVFGRIIGEESCLFLNLFTTKINARLPVMVYFHGVALASGSARDLGAKYFMDEDIVLLTVNYRLSALGFLNTGDDIIRGNMGFKDQTMALRWVQENIRKFGGDPDRVTIFGASAGAISVHYHMMSPLSKGLFHKAISQSGNLALPMAFTKNPQLQAKRFGKKMNCPTKNTTAMVSCLKKVNVRKIVQRLVNIMHPLHTQEELFVGSVEAVKRLDTFLSENPFDLLESGNFNKVPWITGVMSAEGSFKTSRITAYPEILENMGKKWKEWAPILLHYNPNRTDVSEKIRQYYFAESRTSNPGDDLENVTQMLSDALFFHPTHYSALLNAKHAPTYLYYFTYKTKNIPSSYSLMRAVKPTSWIPSELKLASTMAEDMLKKHILKSPGVHDYGACHSDDVLLLWHINWLSEIWKTSKDYPFSRTLVRCFADFAEDDSKLKFDKLPWTPVDPNERPISYMEFDEPARLIDEPFSKIIPFWDSLNIRNPHENKTW